MYAPNLPDCLWQRPFLTAFSLPFDPVSQTERWAAILITAVVAPEDGKEVSLETISLRLAQLVGRNAKRFASTQKEVQVEKKQLEALEEQHKELDEQAKSYEDKVADGLRENEDLESEAGVLQAQLEKQLGINRELEVRLAGMKKLEEEAKKNEPGTEEGSGSGKPKDAESGEGEPDWLKSMHDIIDGKYDNDLKEMRRLLNYAVEELDKPGCDPKWGEIVDKAADRRTELLKAKAKAAGF